MKKLKRILIGLVVLVAIGLIAITQLADSLVSGAIESSGAESLGVEVNVDDVDIGLFSGQSTIEGVTVDNPKGFSSEKFLELGKGTIQVSMEGLTNNPIEVPSLALEKITIRLEQNLSGSNYQTILDHFGKRPKSEDSGKDITINKLVLRDIRVVASFEGADVVDTTIDELVFEDIGTKSKPSSLLDQTGDVLGRLLAGINLEIGSELPGKMGATLGNELGQLEKTLGVTLGDGLEGVGKTVDGALGGAGKAIEGLFGK